MLWQNLEKFPEIKEKQVHVWRASLDRSEKELESFLELLNIKERERADRFIVDGAANNFIIARGILRKLAASYLKKEPQEIIFQQNKYGKLHVDFSPLSFNLSHSKNLALFIFTLNDEVGVDVEFIHEIDNFQSISEKFFSKKETRDLFSLPEDKKLKAFFNCWSRKEAFIKAKGLGVYHGLDNFSVEVNVKKEGRVKLFLPQEVKSSGDEGHWSLEAFDPGEDYSGAFVINTPDYSVEYYNY